MKINKIVGILSILVLLFVPVFAYGDAVRCSTCYVNTGRITDGTNQSLCYDDASCWANITFVNGSLHTTNLVLTTGSGCVGYGSFTATPYGTDAEDLLACTGYCERGDTSGTFDCGNYYAASTTLIQEVDNVEENQATAETNQQNRTATVIANDDANTTTILAAITAAVTSIAQDVWEYTGGRFIDGY